MLTYTHRFLPLSAHEAFVFEEWQMSFKESHTYLVKGTCFNNGINAFHGWTKEPFRQEIHRYQIQTKITFQSFVDLNFELWFYLFMCLLRAFMESPMYFLPPKYKFKCLNIINQFLRHVACRQYKISNLKWVGSQSVCLPASQLELVVLFFWNGQLRARHYYIYFFLAHLTKVATLDQN